MTINKMLIDAAHPEETRVAVLRGDRIEEFDYESANKKLLRGNIYLAKVTRVEPSLQAAFVEYGGNRHGFLAFSDIHPDYYQIPFADRQALLAAQAEEDSEDDDEEEIEDQPAAEPSSDREVSGEDGSPEESDTRAASIEGASESVSSEAGSDVGDGAPQVGLVEDQGVVEIDTTEVNGVEEVGNEDALEEVEHTTRRRRRNVRTYKIQEVIKRRQILLVQVVKEERGNKGAALTTYLSLAGRYTVLMPNTGRGGGISRKITNAADRKRLKEITSELEVSDGMGLIVRTAGAARTKAEVKRDFEYLLRLWETIRDLTLKSTAPALVYEEGNLIRRAIRDLYTKEIEDILVAGDAAFEDARDFMRMLMPTNVKSVQHYTDPEPLFTRFQIERQLNQFYSPQVTLPSGGYIVINQTEALVAIDVNSGKSTREHSIEETALRTNLEACDEVARQLRLRDLAGLVVIDFIDMDERRNNRSVERRMKEALKNDRARIQVGRISHFGLLEMSRQRLRTGVLEGSTSPCPHCAGTGVIRSTESVALGVLRAIEDALQGRDKHSLVVNVSVAAALYILNAKRAYLGISKAGTASSSRSARPTSCTAPTSRSSAIMRPRRPGGHRLRPPPRSARRTWTTRTPSRKRSRPSKRPSRSRPARIRRSGRPGLTTTPIARAVVAAAGGVDAAGATGPRTGTSARPDPSRIAARTAKLRIASRKASTRWAARRAAKAVRPAMTGRANVMARANAAAVAGVAVAAAIANAVRAIVPPMATAGPWPPMRRNPKPAGAAPPRPAPRAKRRAPLGVTRRRPSATTPRLRPMPPSCRATREAARPALWSWRLCRWPSRNGSRAHAGGARRSPLRRLLGG